MKIIQVPAAVLNQAVGPVRMTDGETEGHSDEQSIGHLSPDKRTVNLIINMIAALEGARNPEGVGLAATQVGVSLAIFVMKPKKDGDVTVCINPRIIKLEDLKREEGSQENHTSPNISPQDPSYHKPIHEKGLEGCLSIPTIWGSVKRADRVLLEYTDFNGEHHEQWFEGLEAIIVQHEIDHLNGILFTQLVLEQVRELVKETEDGNFERFKI